MTDEKLKTRSFRVSEEVMEKIKAIQESRGETQDRALASLIHCWEINEARAVIPDRAAEIDAFQMLVNSIMKAYSDSLEAYARLEDVTAGKFETRLKASFID